MTLKPVAAEASISPSSPNSAPAPTNSDAPVTATYSSEAPIRSGVASASVSTSTRLRESVKPAFASTKPATSIRATVADALATAASNASSTSGPAPVGTRSVSSSVSAAPKSPSPSRSSAVRSRNESSDARLLNEKVSSSTSIARSSTPARLTLPSVPVTANHTRPLDASTNSAAPSSEIVP